jgi:hypothetical protein
MYFHEDFISSDTVYNNAYFGDYNNFTQMFIKYNGNDITYLSPRNIRIDETILDNEVEISQDSLEYYIQYVVPEFDYENDIPSITDLDGFEFDLVSTTNFETTEVIVEVTGISSDTVYNNAYFGDYNNFTQMFIKYNGEELTYLSPRNIEIDETILDNEVEITQDSLNYYIQFVIPNFDYENDTPSLTYLDGVEFDLVSSTNFETTVVSIEVTGITNPIDEKRNISMNSNTLELLLAEEKYQVSVMVFDAYNADNVIKDIQELGFNAIYPISVGNEISAILAIATSIYLGFLLGFLMLIIYFISYIVLKNVQNSKKKDYLIFRSIGASKKDLNRVTIIELFLSTIIAYIITMGLLVVNEFFDTFIPQYLRYFTVGSYVFIFLLLSVLALLLGNRFNKKIFSTSVITSLKQD